jgi:GAF domain-containing protein
MVRPIPRSRLPAQQRRSKSSVTPQAAQVEEVALEPDFATLKLIALTQSIPFVGFGFMDNAILIIAGDAIDTSLGVMLGISTMCAAAIGNIISDVAGIMMGTVIEDFCANVLKLPLPNLSTAQRQLRSVRFANQFGTMVGIVIGCVIGMFPLLFIDTKKIQLMKKDAHLETIFRDVVTEAKTLVGAEATSLYLRVSKDEGSLAHTKTYHANTPYRPNADGEYLYSMYTSLPSKGEDGGGEGNHNTTSALARHKSLKPNQTAEIESSKLLPLGRGIISRAALTGEPWNISDVQSEPDFLPEQNQNLQSEPRTMVVVPVLDAQGRSIAVIKAVNKKRASAGMDARASVGNMFTKQDVAILMALASHISVSLQAVYQDPDEEAEVRLRDTIRILKTHGLAGIDKDQEGPIYDTRERNLFPDTQ